MDAYAITSVEHALVRGRPDVEYNARVRAENFVGWGEWSEWSAKITTPPVKAVTKRRPAPEAKVWYRSPDEPVPENCWGAVEDPPPQKVTRRPKVKPAPKPPPQPPPQPHLQESRPKISKSELARQAKKLKKACE